MKAGILTTEFWVTVATQILGLMVLGGFIGPELQTPLGDAIVNASALAMNIVAVVAYIKGRSDVKVASE